MDILINIIHLSSAVIWLGGTFFLHFVLQPSTKNIDISKIMRLVSKNFTIVTWACFLLSIITGFIKTPKGMLFNVNTDMGRYLIIKHVVVLLLVITGLVTVFYLVPRFRKNTIGLEKEPIIEFERYQGRLSNITSFNLFLGTFIIIFKSLL